MPNYKIIKIDDKEYPKKLLEISNSPKELYVIGNTKLLQNTSIAIVGSRESTAYGEKYAFEFSKKLSQKEITIVSGMAIGIDTQAHFGALKEKGKTIAVLGAGFNNIYPEENVYLFNEIIKNGGCVVTEYSPENQVNLSNFPKRNRIISGLSTGVLVVEAKYRSGSSVTAKYAKEQAKKVFCLPGNIDQKTSVGTNNLIQKGAKLVTCVQDILEEINVNELSKNIEEEYKNLYSLILDEPQNINIIAKKSNLGINEVTQKLLIMELKGYIKNLPGNEYVRL